MITPIIEEISSDYAGKIKVGKVNVDFNNQVAMQYGIRGIPALLVFKDGAVANQIVGAVPKNDITQILDEVI
jgi:thioredoxin 1